MSEEGKNMEDTAFSFTTEDAEAEAEGEGSAMDLSFVEQLLFEGCWLETTTDAFNFPPSTSADPLEFTPPFPPLNSYQHDPPPQTQESSVKPQNENENENQNQNNVTSEDFFIQDGRRWWIGPTDDPGTSSSSVRDRLIKAIRYLEETTAGRNVLIQIWVPIKKEGKHVLTTMDQPYTLDSNSTSLQNYRIVSKSYNFAADDTDSKDLAGLPGRVFLGKLPESTPDVRFFGINEYPRLPYAQQLNIRGSLAVPVFERFSGTCLGVIEMVTTSQKIDYRPELENVCKALEAVDLRSIQESSPVCSKHCNDLTEAAAPEILEILGSVCEMYKLPLALTWAPCAQQVKGGCWPSDKNYELCVSTVNSACFVAEKDVLGFHSACSENPLFRGLGIVGKAFETQNQCFATDVTAFSKTEYALSHHAKVFQLCGAVAIPIQSIYPKSFQFVVELFLPKNCRDVKEQNWMVRSLASSIQKASQNLFVVMQDDAEDRSILLHTEIPPLSNHEVDKEERNKDIVDCLQKDKDVPICWKYQGDENEEFKVTTQWDEIQMELQHQQNFQQVHPISGGKSSNEVSQDFSSACGVSELGSRKAGEKRRSKSEKAISLQVLQQYFAGSLKDAARSLGVCPTTLKRICRYHGITRWPSRKIKKVGHSLRKLQLVIDSVEGAQGSIQIGSFYSQFPELSSPKFSALATDQPVQKQSNPQTGSAILIAGATVSKSHSSCSQSSGSSCSTEAKDLTTARNVSCSRHTDAAEDYGGMMKRAFSDAELFSLDAEEPILLGRSHSQKMLSQHQTVESLPSWKSKERNHGDAIRVKATFGEEKVRLSLQRSWSFRDLRQEILRRFNLDDAKGFDLKYLDDDCEWVLLTCDADLEECIDIYKLSQSRTIKISIHHAAASTLGSSFARSVPP